MRRPIIALLSAATLLGSLPAGAADLSYSGRYEHGVPDDWTGDDASGTAVAPEPEDFAPRPRHRHRAVEVVVEDTVVAPPVAIYAWQPYATYPNPCACRAFGAANAYAAGYAYGYALGTFGYAGPASYGAYGWY